MMSHDEFVLGYEKGSLGCSVSVLLVSRLFLAGRIRDKKISINLLLWSLGLLLLIASSVIEFLKLLTFYLGAPVHRDHSSLLRVCVFLLLRSGCPVGCAGQRRFLQRRSGGARTIDLF
jgi:hypothetical protein